MSFFDLALPYTARMGVFASPFPRLSQLKISLLQLNDWHPETLIAYASMTRILAVEQCLGAVEHHPTHGLYQFGSADR